jgi:hypothetical protein
VRLALLFRYRCHQLRESLIGPGEAMVVSPRPHTGLRAQYIWMDAARATRYTLPSRIIA